MSDELMTNNNNNNNDSNQPTFNGVSNQIHTQANKDK